MIRIEKHKSHTDFLCSISNCNNIIMSISHINGKSPITIHSEKSMMLCEMHEKVMAMTLYEYNKIKGNK